METNANSKQVKITLDGKYKTRDGKEARILWVDFKHPDNLCVIAVIKESDNQELLHSYTINGYYRPDEVESIKDLIPVNPYKDFKIDEPVLVSNYLDVNDWQKRHFAGISEDGKPLAFTNGKTSWTAKSINEVNTVTEWNFCRKAD